MNYSVNLSSGQTVEVVIGEAAQINVEQALNYIESGRVEITNYVNEWAKPEIANYTNEYAKPIVTEIVNQTTKPLIDDYLNTTTKPQIDEYVADNVKPYSDSAQDSAAKAKISEDNAKTSETNAKASELAAASSAGVASAAAVTATEAKDYTAKVLADENLKTVGQDLQSADSNIKTVATNIVNVNTVAKNIDNVNILAPHTEAMETIAPDIMDVVTVAGIAEQTKNVSENMADVNRVASSFLDIHKVVNNESNINTVSNSINAVNNVSDNIDAVSYIYINKNAISNVNTNMNKITTVDNNINNIKSVADNIDNVQTVALYTAGINTVSGSIDNVNTVVNDIENINAVAANKVNIDKVAAVKDNIATVATNIVNVNTVAKNIDNVNLLAPHTEAMETIAPDIMDVVTVAGITEQTKNVSENMAHVVAVDNNKANIDKAVANATNITTVATSINNVNAVAGNKANIDNVAANKTNINTVSANITAVNNVSENMADVKNAVQSAADAQKWAIGTIDERPEGSSKYWAEQAKSVAQISDATETVKGIVRLATSDEVTAGTNDSAAITPLKLKSKLDTKQDKSTAINYNNISNCITYIPQDIKLELNNGTLTIKAGSKVYIPNGFESDGTTRKFNIHIIPSDEVIEYGSKSKDSVIICDVNNKFYIASTAYTVSGTTQPTDISHRNIWYDITTNTVKTNSPTKADFTSDKSLPIAIVNCVDVNKFTISQVFNGFGYIGSTVFALPGVKGLIPNGRNTDGSLKSIEFVNDRVRTFTASGSGYGLTYFLNLDYVINLAVVNTKAYAEKDTKLTTFDNNNGVWFDTKQNVMLQTADSGTTWTRVNYVCFSYMFMTNAGHLDYLVSKTAFHALDYNDKSTISGWSMPSSRYIDLSLGASGSTYTAPVNGYFYLVKVAGNDNGYINFLNKTKNITQEVLPKTSNNWLYVRMEAQKGDEFKIVYNTSGDTKIFRFIFAEGEN